MGYECPERQATADFLTSLTNPSERIARSGFEDKVPKTPLEFETYWKNSPEYKRVVEEIDVHMEQVEKNPKKDHHDSHVARQANHVSSKSPYTVSFFMQVKYIMRRNYLRFKGDPSIPISSVAGQLIMALIMGSVFYNLDSTTGSFFSRTTGLFFAVLFNAFVVYVGNS
ncbi:hypothetical protein PGUG_01745 [Meyerozyma guilliermondii ATCC 6260]|uniref:ABC-2 type transporter transmembrane domain-containing protein n=1 Tax=Meyerozyma guilliermondii (strain ATCC 6260 / CBS 566 / DSM 6381 / JCM 1539 / NBRC 10279 / NRRL Y-324) TaxID=294746 RepID=A5DEP4_PICGU|nr:uncharacterized protein PGUG_01745 [Meyerozyma guilliermondii ATCC 6260]EDK37647.2 hypothetical protein PGUG_01745 [Meyerozyma guilliermondii ATCC 6260]